LLLFRRKTREMKPNAQNDPRLLRQIKPSNLLSFGPDTPALELESLNVLIGPNSVGKSNLIEALALMRATPIPPQTTANADVRGVLRRGGVAPTNGFGKEGRRSPRRLNWLSTTRKAHNSYGTSSRFAATNRVFGCMTSG